MSNIDGTGKRFDMVVVGDLNADLILNTTNVPTFGQVEKLVDDATLVLGSSAAIFACGAARLGLRVGFIGKVGNDTFGQFVTDQLTAAGVDTTGIVKDVSAKTGITVILSRGADRAILTYLGAFGKLSFQDIDPAYLRQARHLHIASYFLLRQLKPDVSRLCDLAHESGLSVSLDTNYDPAEEWAVGDLLQHIDIFLPNEVELCAIARQSDTELALNLIGHSVPIVAVKRGADGADLRAGSVAAHADIFPVEVVDTTGAGDTFDAGFLYAWLNGWSQEDALRFAATCGSLSTRTIGGTAGQPTLEEALVVTNRSSSHE